MITLMTTLLTGITVFLATYGGVKIFRRWSLRRELFDVPNERSSHTVPTPRGGGLIIVLVCLGTYALAPVVCGGRFHWSYFLGAALVAAVSWLDDVYSVPFGWRFLAHSAAALPVIFNLGFFGEIYLPFVQTVNIGASGAVITFLWIVWLTNAYNFMDGIDGIAGTQAVTAGIGWLVAGHFLDLPSAGFYGGVIAFSSLGFLIQNWQPAKIFMGDVGSAFLGYSFAALPLLAKNENQPENNFPAILLPTAVLLVWLFVFDSVWTFAGRALRREKVWQAHRGHIYQKMVTAGWSHQAVAVLYGLLSLLIGSALIFWLSEGSDAGIFPALAAGAAAIALLIVLYFVQTEAKSESFR